MSEQRECAFCYDTDTRLRAAIDRAERAEQEAARERDRAAKWKALAVDALDMVPEGYTVWRSRCLSFQEAP